MYLTVKANTPLAPFCSMKVGGNAKYIGTPENIDELNSIIEFMSDKNEKIMILGNASNTLFSDEGFDGAVIFTTHINEIKTEGNRITAYCGASLTSVAVAAQKNFLSGLEFAYGIPGTVGGGVFMNAGAYGGEISDCFYEAVCLTPDLKEVVLTKQDMNFYYRHSVLSENSYTLIKATFELKNGDNEAIRTKMDEFMRMRKDKQPLEYPSCGSTFKRPKDNYAGCLIEQCGLKGFSIGGAEVSEKHAGFIINKGNASANDIIKLIDYVSDFVFEKTGVRLEPEVRIIR
ncbi:MAG: UDP-N-acetylenolpyruvoylglucosamine reductase [Clostridiales bacterium GWF2_36_10]|nr:MAG: UDP-N-acetylenolpyruvoylglucosamine reductase [Clostridiales bacterium GWF2_36_10]